MNKLFFSSIAAFTLFGVGFVLAAPIVGAPSSDRYAWNDVIGWINFLPGFSPAIDVVDDKIIGVANSSAVGKIYFDCTSFSVDGGSLPPGKTCSDYGSWKVSNDYTGKLSGFAWNEAIGWISFDCHNLSANCTDGFVYRVQIDSVTGNFSNYAWNDIIGYISFNCADLGVCPPGLSDYRVRTSWRPPVPSTGDLYSSIFDTRTSATFNTLLWRGANPYGVTQFQVASSNCFNGATNAPLCTTGTWNFVGPNNDPTLFYQADPNTTIVLTNEHVNKRYVRYRVHLESGIQPGVGLQSPRVDDVIINWSR